MRIRHQYLLLGALFALGCSALTSPGSLDGAWKQDITIPGNSLLFTLTTNGDAVAGSGTWSGEACCDGAVSVTGDATGPDVSLTFAFVSNRDVVPPRTSQFTGRMTDANTLSGTFVSSGFSADVVFHRTQ
jgi:hypothetical protein